MHPFFTFAFLAVLVVLTLLAARTWLASRGTPMEPSERRVFQRFVLGLALFWLIGIAGYLAGLMSF